MICVSCTVVSDSFDPMNCSPPGSSIRGILQARILEWVAISYSRGSSQPRDQTRVSCIVGIFFFYHLSHQGNVCYFDLAMGSWVYKYINTYQTVFFKYVQLL